MSHDRRGVRPRHEGSASSLFRSKLRAPVPSEFYVRRARLLELVDDMVKVPITLIVAPAGAGKTSLLAGWVAESSIPAAWLALDETDRDAVQMWRGMIAALDSLVPGVGADALIDLDRPSMVLRVVGRLLDDLDDAGDRSDIVLVIDDLHTVSGDEIVAEALSLFLLNMPRWLHVVALSRSEPPLPLDRLQARDQLRIAHFAELRFLADEAAEMLTRLVPTVSNDVAAATAKRTGGWAAGLHLAALAARSAQARQDVPTMSADPDVVIEDYVLHEVLNAEDPELTDVLSSIAVVDRVSPGLAAALAGRGDVSGLLRHVEAHGFFVSRIEVSDWYELHELVREALLADLRRNSPEHILELHRRAALWFEEAGEVPLALTHWLLAEAPREALRLLAAASADLYNHGHAATIERIVDEMPTELVSADLAALLDFAWCHLLVDQHRFGQLVDQAHWLSLRTKLTSPLKLRLRVLSAFAAGVTGDWSAGGALAHQAMDEAGLRWWNDPIARYGWNVVARSVAMSERWDDSSDEVREATMALGRDPERLLVFEGTRALGEVLAGRPAVAVEVAAGVRRSAEVANIAILRTELATAEALAHRELGDAERAVAELTEVARTHADPLMHCRVLAQLDLIEAHLDRGDIDRAQVELSDAEALMRREFPGSDMADRLARAVVRVKLSHGDLIASRTWANRITDDFWRNVSLARVLLVEDQRTEAMAALETATPRCVRHEVVRDLLRSRAADNAEHAAAYAANAVRIAAAEGLVHTVAVEAHDVFDLVEKSAAHAPSAWLDRVRRAAAWRGRAVPRGRIALGEVLTQRERDVLRFLPSRLSVREIADELFISVNTVKFHLKIIYRKLGVRTRSEAAQVARR